MLNRDISINEIITKHPKVQQFLLLNDVDCMKCSVKSCLLKDILEYHNFSGENQKLMYAHMDKLASGESDEMIQFTPEEKKSEFSKIVETLIHEHNYIKELIYVMKYISTKANFLEKYQTDIATISNYLSIYADKFHHQKEEDLLFSLFRDKEIVSAMFEEHELGRSFRKAIVESTNDTDAKNYIDQFCEMLENHIYKEDNVLFPYLDNLLTEDDITSTTNHLSDYDLSLEDEVKQYLKDFNNSEFKLS